MTKLAKVIVKMLYLATVVNGSLRGHQEVENKSFDTTSLIPQANEVELSKFGDNICVVDCKRSGKKLGECMRECGTVGKALCITQCKQNGGTYAECALQCVPDGDKTGALTNVESNDNVELSIYVGGVVEKALCIAVCKQNGGTYAECALQCVPDGDKTGALTNVESNDNVELSKAGDVVEKALCIALCKQNGGTYAECALQCVAGGDKTVALTDKEGEEEDIDGESNGWYSNLCFIKCRRNPDNDLGYWGCAKECDIPQRLTTSILCYSECRGTTRKTMAGCALTCYNDPTTYDPRGPNNYFMSTN